MIPREFSVSLLSILMCNGQVSHCLSEILDLCQSFCGLISHSEVVLSAQESARLEDIATVCALAFLFRHLSVLRIITMCIY